MHLSRYYTLWKAARCLPEPWDLKFKVKKSFSFPWGRFVCPKTAFGVVVNYQRFRKKKNRFLHFAPFFKSILKDGAPAEGFLLCVPCPPVPTSHSRDLFARYIRASSHSFMSGPLLGNAAQHLFRGSWSSRYRIVSQNT